MNARQPAVPDFMGKSLLQLLLIFGILSSVALPISATDIFTIGSISKSPEKNYKRRLLMAKYLEENLIDLGITRVRVIIAASDDEMLMFLERNKIDLLSDESFFALKYADQVNLEPIARRWRGGAPEYRSVFFKRRESKIGAIEELVGKTIAFQYEGSNTGFQLPAAMLISKGLTLEKLNSPKQKPAPNHVGYIFSEDEYNSASWVKLGLVDAAALSNLDWMNRQHIPTEIWEELELFAESMRMPRGVEWVRGGLSTELKNRITHILFNMHLDPTAKTVLRKNKRTLKYDPIDDTQEALLENIRRLLYDARETVK